MRLQQLSSSHIRRMPSAGFHIWLSHLPIRPLPGTVGAYAPLPSCILNKLSPSCSCGSLESTNCILRLAEVTE